MSDMESGKEPQQDKQKDEGKWQNLYLMKIGLMIFITFVCCIAGVKIGSLFGSKYEAKAEFFGGVVLIAMGLKILIEHLLG